MAGMSKVGRRPRQSRGENPKRQGREPVSGEARLAGTSSFSASMAAEQVALCGSCARLLVQTLSVVRWDSLRFSDKQRLRRVLARLAAQVASAMDGCCEDDRSATAGIASAKEPATSDPSSSALP